MSVPQDQLLALLQGAMNEDSAPANPERLNALRRQQAVGVLGQMGGKNVGQFGQSLYSGATQQLQDMEQQEGQGLNKALQAMQLAKGYKDLMGEDDEWVYKADPVHGGIIAINKRDPNKVMPITGSGEGGGGLISEANPYGLQLGGNRKPREDEVRSGYNLGRITHAATTIGEMTRKSPGLQKPGLMEQIARGQEWDILEGLLQPEERQIIEAAQSDMLDAALWLATGAAYNREQLLGQARAYLPKWQDKAATIAYKRKALANLIQDAHRRAGAAVDPQMLQKSLDALDSLYSIPGVGAPAEAGKPWQPPPDVSIKEIK